jgi:hypothetical protein
VRLPFDIQYPSVYIWNPVHGQVAQLVEQWTENPCVGGSIPSLSTKGGRKAALLHNGDVRIPESKLTCDCRATYVY